MHSDSIQFRREGNCGVITLNRPAVFNSFNREMALTMQRVLKDCEDDHSVRCIVITGEGKAFCAGQDLGEVTSDHPPGFQTILDEHYNPIVRSIQSMNKPIIAAVNGVAAGAGANMALCCDIVVMSSQASFIQAFSKIGLVPDSGGTWILPRIIGWQRASALMMTGDKVDAMQSLAWGMCYKVYEPDHFLEGWQKLAQQMAAMPTISLGYTKKLLSLSATQDFGAQLQSETEYQMKSGATADYSEGVKAFMEKRKPIFHGE
jgi:2-(1,2-epoxy-1,2-dihydrophenyl)acetyl-CoA isomerase